MKDQEPLEIKKSKILIVEGKDEERFFDALCKHMNLTDIQVIGIGGKTKLRSQLKALISTPGFKQVTSLGIIRDADDDFSASFQSICGALQEVNLPTPSKPFPELVSGPPKVAIFILPDNQSQGTLEDLCLQTIACDLVKVCVDEYFHCLCQHCLPMPKPRQISKAKVQVYLASKPDPTKRLGESAQVGYWDLSHPAFGEIRKFLQKLCEDK